MIKKLIHGLTVTALSSPVLAHTGHDHGHWMSSSIHFLTGVALFSVVAVAVFATKKIKKKRLLTQNK